MMSSATTTSTSSSSDDDDESAVAMLPSSHRNQRIGLPQLGPIHGSCSFINFQCALSSIIYTSCSLCSSLLSYCWWFAFSTWSWFIISSSLMKLKTSMYSLLTGTNTKCPLSTPTMRFVNDEQQDTRTPISSPSFTTIANKPRKRPNYRTSYSNNNINNDHYHNNNNNKLSSPWSSPPPPPSSSSSAAHRTCYYNNYEDHFASNFNDHFKMIQQEECLSKRQTTTISLVLMIKTLLAIILIIDQHHQVMADRNRFYHISALCLRERVHPLSKKIDGAVITSKAENNLDCTITFQTDTILQKFMLRFEKLALDCNDHLYIYDGAHTIGNHKVDLSCRSTRREVGTIYTQSNFLTLRYTTDAYSKADNGFRLIITAYKDSKNFCREHRCEKQYCISRDLVCDGVNHCGDDTDEKYCQESEIADTIIGLDPMMFIAIVSSVFVSCLACVISVAFCLCRRERFIRRQQHQQQIALQQQQQQQQYQMHDTGHHLGTTPLMSAGAAHHHHATILNNNVAAAAYGATKLLDGACTMITSLDYGATQTALTRNGGLVNSYTHTTLPNTQNNHFSTLPHQHSHHLQHNHQVLLPAVVGQASPTTTTANAIAQQPHVRFGTLPSGASANKPSPPPYPGGNGVAITATSTTATAITVPNASNASSTAIIPGAAIVQLPPNSSQPPILLPNTTQVIYSSK